MGEKKEIKSKDSMLPLFEYAKHYEDFETFESYDHFFVHCLHTSGYRMSTIARWMGLSETGLSIRMNLTNPEGQPRFTGIHQDLYVSSSGDPRPGRYLLWRAEKAKQSSDEIVKEKVVKLIPHIREIRELCDLLEHK